MRVPLLKHQFQFLQAKTKFLAFVGGIGSGKSTGGAHYIIGRMLKYPKAMHFIGANSYSQLRDATLSATFGVLDQMNIPFEYNQNHGLLEIEGGKALCKTMENFNLLRGIEIGSFWLDEARDLRREAFEMMMGRLRDKHVDRLEGRITTTSNGFDWIYDYFDPSGPFYNPEFGIIKATSYENKFLPNGYIHSLKSQYSADLFKQEILAEFINVQQGRVYSAFSQDNLKEFSPFSMDNGTWVPHLPVVAGLDFNVSPMSWTLGQCKYDEFYWFDEINIKSTNTFEASKVLALKVLDMKANGFRAEPNVIICGDASGESRNTKSAGQTDYDILCQELDSHGITWQNLTPKANPPVKDRVNNVNAKLKASNGSIKMWAHPTKCSNLKRDWERVSWKTGAVGAIIDKTSDPDLTHSSDSIGYPVCVLSPLQLSGSVGGLKVLRRW